MFDCFPPTSSEAEAMVSNMHSGNALAELHPATYPFPVLRLQASDSASLCFGLSLCTMEEGTVVSTP